VSDSLFFNLITVKTPNNTTGIFTVPYRLLRSPRTYTAYIYRPKLSLKVLTIMYQDREQVSKNLFLITPYTAAPLGYLKSEMSEVKPHENKS